MDSQELLADLLVEWEEARRRGENFDLKAACRDSPELLEPLRKCMHALDAMDKALDYQPDGADPRHQRQDNTETSSGRLLNDLRPGMEPVPGYKLEAIVGRGGFGQVWKATGPGGFQVALKFVSVHGRTGSLELRSLDVLKNLRHPNLLSTFGAWQIEDVIVIAMELADGTLFDRLISARKQISAGIPFGELIRYMEGAADGIDYLNAVQHRLGSSCESVAVQHRDIKPQNLLLIGGGVKVADFGLLRALEKNEASHSGSMTLAYAPPEFADGRTANTSDKYSLAITYCHLRGGRLPFTGTAGQILDGHRGRDPDLSMLPAPERTAVARALEKDPNSRWPNCRSFVDNLIRPQEKRPRRSWGTRLRVLVAMIVISALLVIGLILYQYQVNSDVSPEQAAAQIAAQREAKVREFADAAGRQIMDGVGGGQDLVVSTRKWSFDEVSMRYSIDMQVKFKGKIIRSNAYSVSGELVVAESGRNPQFSKSLANKNFEIAEMVFPWVDGAIKLVDLANK